MVTFKQIFDILLLVNLFILLTELKNKNTSVKLKQIK